MEGLDIIHRWFSIRISPDQAELYLGTSQAGLFRTNAITSVEREYITPLALPTLFQNCPNPFNSTTRIGYSLTQTVHVTIALVDILGRRVKTVVDESKPPGSYTATVDAHDLSSGVYVCQLETSSGHCAFTKVLLIR
jgi:hypothetical protein